MRNISLEELLEAGCHFGHQVVRSNPKARDYIFEARDGIHIIDLAKTKEGLEEAGKFVKKLAQNPNSSIIVVGTKRQSNEIINKDIEKSKKEIKIEPNIFYVTSRWIGGLLTNFTEVNKNFKKLADLNEKLADTTKQQGFTKKEIREWQRDRDKLNNLYGGVFTMTKKPDALFIVDAKMEDIAVKEAIRTNVPTVAITDTNADPHVIDYPIPANDDATGSLDLIIGYITDAWIEGKNSAKQPDESSKPKDKKEKDAKVKKEEKKKEPKKAVKSDKIKPEKKSSSSKKEEKTKQ